MNPNDNNSEQPTPQPVQPIAMPPAPKKSQKKLIIVIGAIVGAILLIGGIIAAVIGMNGQESPLNNTTDSTVTAEVADVIDRPDGTLTLDSSIDGQTSIKEQNLTATLNQQVNLSSGFSFMITDVSRINSFQRTSIGEPVTVTPDAGNEFIKVSFVAGSRLEEGNLSYSSFTFTLAHAQTDVKYAAETFLSTDPVMPETYYNLKKYGKLENKDQESFILYYEVPTGAPLYIEVERNFKNYANGDAVTVAGRVTLR